MSIRLLLHCHLSTIYVTVVSCWGTHNFLCFNRERALVLKKAVDFKHFLLTQNCFTEWFDTKYLFIRFLSAAFIERIGDGLFSHYSYITYNSIEFYTSLSTTNIMLFQENMINDCDIQFFCRFWDGQAHSTLIFITPPFIFLTRPISTQLILYANYLTSDKLNKSFNTIFKYDASVKSPSEIINDKNVSLYY